MKGIGLPGAFSVLEEHEFRSQNVAGTSAGAITVALIADAAPFVGGAGGGDKGFPYASLDYAQDAFTEAYGVEI